MSARAAWATFILIIVGFFSFAILCCSSDADRIPEVKMLAETKVRIGDWYKDEHFKVANVGDVEVPGTGLTRIIVIRERDNKPFAYLVPTADVPAAGKRVRIVAVVYDSPYGYREEFTTLQQ